tara:strand:+ start:1669 stop:2574 length:906 start_codon:yes stop_codon:yes gene_type:complete
MDNLHEYLHKLPKADVHSHFHLGGSQKRFLEKHNASFSFPKNYDGLDGMIHFIYKHLNNYMTTKEDVINFMEMSIQSSIDDNITYLEASVDVGLARFFNDSIEAVIYEIKKIKEKHKSKINFRPEIGFNKELPLKKVYSYAEICIDSGVFNGIDIYGKEAGQNLLPFQELFKTAKKNNLKTKVHIGEFSGYKSINEAILLLNPDEIQHGISAVNSQKTIDLILERNIRLNICLKSNILLGAVKSFKTHPIKILFDKGVKVTVNTDDLILFNATVTKELNALYENNIFSIEDINIIRKNAFS